MCVDVEHLVKTPSRNVKRITMVNFPRNHDNETVAGTREFRFPEKLRSSVVLELISNYRFRYESCLR